MALSCSSEAKTPKDAARAYRPIGDLMFLSMRDAFVIPNTDIKNRVPDSKILYDVQNFVAEGGFKNQVRVEVREQVVILRGSVPSGTDADTLERGVQKIFGVRYVVNALELR